MTAPTFVVSRVACDGSHQHGDNCEYRVNWAINPHMRIGASSFAAARGEHQQFRTTLERLGAALIELPFVHAAFDSVFCKDNGILTARAGTQRVLMASPMHGERALEQKTRAHALADIGFEVCAPPSHRLEGGDVVVLPDGAALLGYGPRSSMHAADTLATFLDAPVTPLELVDPHFFHLDVALAFLSDGTVLVCREAFSTIALATIERLGGVSRVVPVSRQAALAFGLNMVEVAGSVVLGSHVAEVETALTCAGFTPVVAPLAQFHLAGGSAACLAARVHRRDVAHRDVAQSGIGSTSTKPLRSAGSGPIGCVS